jgi:hypothetical protein
MINEEQEECSMEKNINFQLGWKIFNWFETKEERKANHKKCEKPYCA